MNIKQGDVLVIRGDYTTEKVIVIQNNKGNCHSPTTIVYSVIDGDIFVRTIDKKRIIKRIGHASDYSKQEILHNLKLNLLTPSEKLMLT
ncbi:hypothetical protein ACKXGF_07570 [Alkalibacillus sp. S2W]|uniref:hypothetical protein n=1 Tax=Alkalibacillus sp. S2W TaxID=3386553 RepID=UPI00398D4CE6